MFIISSVCLCRWFSHHTHLSPQNVGYLSFLNQSDTQLLPSLIVLLKLTPACSLSDGSFFLTDDSTPRWRTGDALWPVQWKPLLRAASNRPLSPLHHKTHVCVFVCVNHKDHTAVLVQFLRLSPLASGLAGHDTIHPSSSTYL